MAKRKSRLRARGYGKRIHGGAAEMADGGLFMPPLGMVNTMQNAFRGIVPGVPAPPPPLPESPSGLRRINSRVMTRPSIGPVRLPGSIIGVRG